MPHGRISRAASTFCSFRHSFPSTAASRDLIPVPHFFAPHAHVPKHRAMSNYYGGQGNAPYGPGAGAGGASAAQNLQFYPSSYSPAGVSGAATPQQASYGFGGAPAGVPFGTGAPQGNFSSPGFGGAGGVSGRMGEHGGLRTGWLAAFSTEGYDGEPPLLEELGMNFGHIQSKVRIL